MTFLEFFIVYLACGAPFSVERLLSSNGGSPVIIGFSAAINLATWPAVLFLKLARVIQVGFVSQIYSANSKMVDISHSRFMSSRRELSYLLSKAAPDRYVGEINELLERYSGLAELWINLPDVSIEEPSELIRLSGHPAPEVAAACLSRRNSAAIERHFHAARDEFFVLLSDLLPGSLRSKFILASALEFTSAFDPESAYRISLIIKSGPESESSSGHLNADQSKVGLPAAVDWPS